MHTVIPFPERLRRAGGLPCPIERGLRVPCGWRNYFSRRVESVGDEPRRLTHGWLAPVMYGSGAYGLVHFRFPDEESLYDRVINVRPDSSWVRALLYNADFMPRLLPSDEAGAVRLCVEHIRDDVEGVFDEKSSARRVAYALTLYGVLGIREGRKDEAEELGIDLPTHFSKWA